MKAWLKGGLIGLGIEVILGLIIFITPIFNKIIVIPVMIGYFLCSLISCFGENFFYINLVLSPVIWFIFGAIIGWFIGKVKSKKIKEVKK